MGSWYGVVLLCSKYYLEYSDQSTGWSEKAVEMTDEQVTVFERFESDYCNKREDLLKGFINE
tara:strand:- start:3560 stop:3745 length:186 start_codon:yes stop_codon:yes gene_type:complete